MQDFQILDDDFAYAGSLDFDDDRAPVAHRGAMHLAQRGRGHRLRLELRESFGDAHAQLVRHDLFDFLKGETADIILQARERIRDMVAGEGLRGSRATGPA